ncbi:hypothetical protein vBYenSP400_16 [Yersinia phage vB_YenS_P400]|nr:hypothetical protein vBYenSP400_16 [Yersinia phage vB_YenS_P400]
MIPPIKKLTLSGREITIDVACMLSEENREEARLTGGVTFENINRRYPELLALDIEKTNA